MDGHARDARAESLVIEPVDIAQIAGSVAADYQGLTQRTVTVSSEEGLRALGSAEALDTVLRHLVENAVRHGLASKEGVGHVTIAAHDAGADAVISVEDDGVGSEPDVVRAVLAGESDADSVGLGNVDLRLRQVFGDDYGLEVETAPGAGTKVSFRVPKYAPGVHAG